MASTRRQTTLSNIGEFQLIRSVAKSETRPCSEIILGIGDDGAILQIPPKRHLVASTDLLIEHIHFNTRSATFFEIGYKAAVANFSDMAAMGAKPTALLVSVAFPAGRTFQDWQELYRGLSAPCKSHNVRIVGGDTSSSHSDSFLSITVLGTVEQGCALHRSGALKGHVLYVSGTLGDSSAGLDFLSNRKRNARARASLTHSQRYLVQRHFHPSPRITLGACLGSRHWASAAIDISDGLSNDLGHLCKQSRVGAIIFSENLPLSPSLKQYAVRKKTDPLRWALHGGEDYELLFTVPPQYTKKVEHIAQRVSVPITKIGLITSSRSGIRLQNSEGTVMPLPSGGYDHFYL
ncbi:MAG: thiamine-phosphate kinase [Nitrospirales bacterium]|nr:thiamine-phosphate kinase [Nitrospirales bacterium]